MGVTTVDVEDDVPAEAAASLHHRRTAFRRLADRGARGELERTRRDWEARKAAQRGEGAE
ncbi:type II toxin-antitoxin system VapB family antitoxin [Streptomyces sp. TX20-6-3]|uniref:type II toxin-antitoxin system VapB family antitoxin n=1 Tax=Streptomyces sp. TX20-6-3 TaxID=3028705 RepID=UPI0029B9BADF|nr:type II toxin-antitoxin system VapB family antitoxin [Streptomyces sp. TX20-6-3]MDX2558964.1 type II toxin-antitoxin system VapB family antitoxin [Streptomyces sp. TX20-6-3]